MRARWAKVPLMYLSEPERVRPRRDVALGPRPIGCAGATFCTRARRPRRKRPSDARTHAERPQLPSLASDIDPDQPTAATDRFRPGRDRSSGRWTAPRRARPGCARLRAVSRRDARRGCLVAHTVRFLPRGSARTKARSSLFAMCENPKLAVVSWRASTPVGHADVRLECHESWL